MELVRKLRQREAAGNPIRVGIIGCGQMGSGVAHTINNIAGMTVCAVADVEPERGIRTLIDMGRPRETISVTDRQSEAQAAHAGTAHRGNTAINLDTIDIPSFLRHQAD